MNNLPDALAYAARGMRVFPLAPGEKEPLISKSQGGNGHLDATTDPAQIRAWWTREPEANIGIACGYGFDVLDVDGPKGRASLTKLLADAGVSMIATSNWPCSITGRDDDGAHFWFQDGGPVRHKDFRPGLDWLGLRGYVVAPPSIHPSGKVYQWQRALNGELPAAPEWLHRAATRPVREVRPPRLDLGQVEGERPGDDFNRRMPWPELLEADGARLERRQGEVEYWTRPDGDKPKPRGVSASIGHQCSRDGRPLLWNFSGEWPGLEADCSYSQFAYWTFTRHGGNWEASGKDLYAQGYGEHRNHDGRQCRAGCPNVQCATCDWWLADLTDHEHEMHDVPEAPMGGATDVNASTSPVTASDREPAAELTDFLNEDEPEYDWLIPNLLERRDRVCLTGPEGGGKSTFLRQVGMQCSSGIHPFTLEEMEPMRVLVIDLENGRAFIKRELRKLYAKVSQKYDKDKRLFIEVQPGGLDLFGHRPDIDWLRFHCEARKAELLIIGPAYKMASGNPNDQEPNRAIQEAIDKIRGDFGVAVMLEMHSGHGTGNGPRPIRPIGWSGWLRWPEFGIHLSEGGAVKHWRGDRDGRDWPKKLKRGGEWPWTMEKDEDRILWEAMIAWAYEIGYAPTQRELAEHFETSKTRISRLIKSHGDGAIWRQVQEALDKRERPE